VAIPVSIYDIAGRALRDVGGEDLPVIFLNESYGAGKTSTLDHVGDLLAEAGKPFSLMDVDWFTAPGLPALMIPPTSFPSPQTWPSSGGTKRAGPRQLVVSGVIASRQDRAGYETRADGPLYRSSCVCEGPSGRTPKQVHLNNLFRRKTPWIN
jgi:hypothetical protein